MTNFGVTLIYPFRISILLPHVIIVDLASTYEILNLTQMSQCIGLNVENKINQRKKP